MAIKLWLQLLNGEDLHIVSDIYHVNWISHGSVLGAQQKHLKSSFPYSWKLLDISL